MQLSKTAQCRILRNLKELATNQETLHITGGPQNNQDLSELKFTISINDETNYYNHAKIQLLFKIPQDFPFKPPRVTTINKVYHPNFSFENGQICLDTLQNNWTPALNLTQTLLSIESLLMDPNPSSPLNSEAAQLYTRDKEAYKQKVQQYVQQYLQ